VWTANRVLEELGSELALCPQVELEFSLRLRQGCVEAQGRFGCWLEGRGSADFEPMARAIERLGAPAPVRAAQRRAELPIRQGVGVAFDENGPEFRLYLHGRDQTTLADHYRAWRWRPGEKPRRSIYTFHFLPETPSGQRPLDLIGAELRPTFSLLLADERLQESSGFWLRAGEGGEIEQVDLAFPWRPLAGALPGLLELSDLLAIPAEEPSRWRELAIRHVAARIGSAAPAITLYASAPLNSLWPADEAAMQEQVRNEALAFHREVEAKVYRRLPSPTVNEERAELGSFYDGPVSIWQAVLGSELHYHAGLFDTPDLEPDDAAMDAALRRAVTELYPFIPSGGRIYDIGCGWGGPLAMWIRDLGCPSLGLTISRDQFRYAASRGLPARWGDAERTLPPGHFDCMIMLESLSHIHDKARLLRTLRSFTDRLVMRVNCQDGSPPSPAFGGAMQMISSSRLRELLEASGWRVKNWRDRRREALPSVAVWHRRLQSLPATGDRHLETLRAWLARVMTAPEAWACHNPLIEAVAEPAPFA
jgi:2-polyprenyl-3-methyl-5-hydroxy-6-metoxy-1,4-benzoquinol methylase